MRVRPTGLTLKNLKSDFLYWFRDNPERDLTTDVEWATERFRRKFGKEPSKLLVNSNEIINFNSLELSIRIEMDSRISQGYIGVL